MGSTGYEAPRVHDLGTLQEITRQQFNKVGQTPDIYTAITGNNVIGSLVPAQ